MNYRELTTPQLLRLWKSLVNDNVMVGRDSHLIKESLIKYTPIQLLLGFYRFKEQRTVTIPQFLKQEDDWLELDEKWAEVELACFIANNTPAWYNVYLENKDSWSADYYMQALEAKKLLDEWAERVIG